MPSYQPAQAWEDLAREVVRARPELRHVMVGSIIFVENVDSKGDTVAKLRRLSPLFQYLLDKDFVLEISLTNTENYSPEQRTLLLYDQLRHITDEGKLEQHDVREWAEVYAAVPDWRVTRRQLPDILAPTFDWDRFRGPQMTIGEAIEATRETLTELKKQGVTVTVGARQDESPEDDPAEPESSGGQEPEIQDDSLIKAVGQAGDSVTQPGYQGPDGRVFIVDDGLAQGEEWGVFEVRLNNALHRVKSIPMTPDPEKADEALEAWAARKHMTAVTVERSAGAMVSWPRETQEAGSPGRLEARKAILDLRPDDEQAEKPLACKDCGLKPCGPDTKKLCKGEAAG
ncbi:MAG: hypothetical protein M1598_03735 [Actinobacteria bacterium]|nr:hypothetical protein [Actinomycetota bacterium]